MNPRCCSILLFTVVGLAGAAEVTTPAAPTTRTSTTSYGIRISRETTYLTAPPRPDGMVDYPEALNAETSAGVTAGYNAACLLVRIVKDGEDRWMKMPDAVLTRMGIDPAGPRIFRVDTSNEIADLISDRELQTRPWSRDDLPEVAAWLERNAAAIDLFVEASRRPQWWVPARSFGEIMIETGSSGLWSSVRSLAIALQVRSMLKLAKGDAQGACDDLAACTRMAGLVSRSPDSVGKLLAAAMHIATARSVWALLEHGDLPPAVLRQLDEALQRRLDFPSRGEWILPSQRYESLMQVAYIARSMQEAMDKNREGLREQFEAAGLLLPDWNRVMRNVNAFCDLLQANETRMSPDERKRHRSVIEEQIAGLEATGRDAKMEMRPDGTMDTTWLFPRVGENRDAYTDRVGSAILTLTLRPSSRFKEKFAACHEVDALTRVALALVRHRQEQGRYPVDLQALVPRYLPDLPEQNAQRPLNYRMEGNGFVLTIDTLDGSQPQLPERITIRRDR